ncbi:molybdenum cofactor guanylyltransferase [Membranihabitans maritimus]|uniref:molybdenum cofactor guanylyltransferase n=1 Tax=Membranihabitans maritimus TaxID=2904244 RepID=UPI001F3CB783|nr:molybdenum cofactor guanylyltransferase [Membranihabitans maritimus]
MTLTGNRLYGLVLAGGKSTRMGADKGLIEYHGIPQREYVYSILSSVCDDVFMSLRQEQASQLESSFKRIVDKNEFPGPLNGIMSAHDFDKEASWFVLACDLPLLDKEAVRYIFDRRNDKKMATTYAKNKDSYPEPLVTIWESTGLKSFRERLDRGERMGPRKFLIDSDIELVFPDNEKILMNVNTMEDYEQVRIRESGAGSGVHDKM